MDYRSTLASKETLQRIDIACRKRFPLNEDEAIECSNCVYEYLVKDDYACLKKFKGNSKFTTFLYPVINNFSIECHRKKYGRKRVPKPIEKLGALETAIYELICFERFSVDEVYEILRMREQFDGAYEDYQRVVAPIREKGCHEDPRFTSMEDRKGNTMDISDKTNNPLEKLLAELESNKRIVAGRVISESFDDLSEEDRTLARLVWASDRSAAAAARALGISPQTARNRLKKIQIQIRKKLLEKGIR
jgi:RNA polymerase sigma factor (sigma-70 family)